MSDMTRQSPLIEHGINPTDGPEKSCVRLGERPFLEHYILRANAHDDVVTRTLNEQLGVTLPTVPNKMVHSGAGMTLWLSPSEWLILLPGHGSGSDRESAIHLVRERIAAQHAALIDVSSGQTLVFIHGPSTREVLARGCPFDLHPCKFGPFDCAQTHFEHVPITLWLDTSTPDPQENPWINIIVRRSFADYFWHRLEDSARSVRAVFDVLGDKA